jgi:hypothetical protein
LYGRPDISSTIRDVENAEQAAALELQQAISLFQQQPTPVNRDHLVQALETELSAVQKQHARCIEKRDFHQEQANAEIAKTKLLSSLAKWKKKCAAFYSIFF